MYFGQKGKNKNKKGSTYIKGEKIIEDAIYGLAVGDAMGVPYEFEDRKNMDKHPCTEMVGYGTYYLIPSGYWSDDTAMALATLDSIAENKSINLNDIMEKFVKWIDNGSYACNKFVFDYGATTGAAINNFKSGVNVNKCGLSGENNNGNGSLMRILPVCIYEYCEFNNNGKKISECMKAIHSVSDLTHRTLRCRIACGLYFFVIKGLLYYYGTAEERIQKGLDEGFSYYENIDEYKKELEYFQRIRNISTLKKINRKDIKSSGYVVDTIEASLWCLITTKSYKECILKAVNLGGDTDTIAAISGGIAGIIYGRYNFIDWSFEVDNHDYIDELCDRFYNEIGA